MHRRFPSDSGTIVGENSDYAQNPLPRVLYEGSDPIRHHGVYGQVLALTG
jgi:hypothetical protein